MKKLISIILALILIFMSLGATSSPYGISDLNNAKTLLREFEAQNEDGEIIYSSTYYNGNLFAIVVTRLKAYEKNGKSLERRYYIVLNVGRYDVQEKLWNLMTSQLLDDSWYEITPKVEATNNSSFKIIISEELKYTLSFSGDQFALCEADNIFSDTSSVPIKDSGVLLGLEGDGLKTFYICADDGKLNITQKNGAIIVPTQDGFYKIANFEYDRTERNVKYGLDDYSREFVGQRKYDDYFSLNPSDNPTDLARQRGDDYDELYGIDGFDESDDTLSFITNKYVSYHNSYMWFGGGSGRSRTPTAFFSEIRDMNADRFKVKNGNIYNDPDASLQNKHLIDMLPSERKTIESKVEQIRKHYADLNRQIKNEQGTPEYYWQKYFVDIENLFLVHDAGKLKLKLAVEVCYYAPNGSPFAAFDTYIDLGVKMPREFTNGNTLCVSFDKIKERIPEATDAYSSPDKNILVVEAPRYIGVYLRSDKMGVDFELERPDYSIYKDNAERIVMAEFAEGQWAGKWANEIKNMPMNDPVYYSKTGKSVMEG